MDLIFDSVRKEFGEKLAVEIPALSIHSGEFFTFVGPSGCGKSTTLNLIAGLESPTRGSIRLGDRELTHLPPHKRDVAFVFQTYALYPHRTVFRNLAFPLELAGADRETIRKRVQHAAAMLGLTPLLEKYPRQLSGGERQRVALGRAIVRQPKLFLFDEPLSNLDAPLRAQMRKELKRLHGELGTTFVYVTHDQEEALSLSSRIAVMRAGRPAQVGTPRKVYDAPANTFVASFFGSPPMNLLDAELRREGIRAALTVSGQELWLENPPASLRDSRRARLGVRPEHLRLSRVEQSHTWPAEVALVELHGSQSFLELRLAKLRLMAVAPAGAGFEAGEKVHVSLPLEHLHLFDADTGERIT